MASKICWNNNNNNNSEIPSSHSEVQEIVNWAQLLRPLSTANCSDYAVAHSNVRLNPARHTTEVKLLPDILQTMRMLKLTQMLRLQSYAWPHLQQGAAHGAVIVGAPGSGRTLSYVPPLCEAVCKVLSEKRSKQQWDLLGPVAIILAPDLGRVQQIGSLCSAMLRKARNEEWLTLALAVPSARCPEFFQRLLNGVGCLIATPVQLLWLCSTYNLKMPCLQFVVYDDVNLMVPEVLQQAHKQLVTLARPQQTQLVIVSQAYHQKLLHMLREFCANPMLLFGDILEAAAYGGVRIRMLLIKHDSKRQELLKLLEERPPHKLRTVIWCQSDAEISEVSSILLAQGYCTLPYYETSNVAVREHVHQWMQHTRGEVLICTDDCHELDIRDAQTLVHYSMSDSWTRFKRRHLMLAYMLRNCFRVSQSVKTEGLERPQSLILLDEGNDEQLPRLVDFLQMHQSVDERIVQLACRIRQQIESSKRNEPTLCDLLLSQGYCGDAICEQRHQLLPHDRELPAMMPCSGDVKLHVVSVYSPTHYCVRLLEYCEPDGSWHQCPQQISMELQLQLKSQDCLPLWPPEPKQVCVYRNECGWERVRILSVPPIEHKNISQTDVLVDVQAMDVNTRHFKTKNGKLYICPEELRTVPPLAIDLRLVGMVPFTGERSWHADDGRKCAYWLHSVPQPNFLQANIVSALSHTIFANDLVATSYAPSLKLHVRRLSMRAQLMQSKLAKKCGLAIAKLMKFLEHDEISTKKLTKKVPFANEMQKNSEYKQIVEGKSVEKPILTRRYVISELALQMAKENNRRLQAKPSQDQPTDTPKSSVEAFFNCLMKCSLLNEKNSPQELLSKLIEPQKEDKHTKIHNTKQKILDKAKDAPIKQSLELHYETPLNVLRPEVTYYQTQCTLELQALLPTEDLSYSACLQNSSCVCFCSSSESDTVRYQFMVNTQCPYQSLTHRKQGRTVYLSLLKLLAVAYPLDFGFYKFMKPQLDKLNILEVARRSIVDQFKMQLISLGLIDETLVKYTNDEYDSNSDEVDEDFANDNTLESAKNYHNYDNLH